MKTLLFVWVGTAKDLLKGLETDPAPRPVKVPQEKVLA